MNALDMAKLQDMELVGIKTKSIPFSKMSNKQQRGKLTDISRQEAEDKMIVLLIKYNMQNGFLNWGKWKMEME